MKVIKLFEEFSGVDKQYFNCDRDEFRKYLDIPSFDSEVDTVGGFFDFNESESYLLNGFGFKKSKNSFMQVSDYLLLKIIGILTIRLYKVSDDWYFVTEYNKETLNIKYYKCDEFDGLLSCLEDVYGINKNNVVGNG